MTTKKKKLAKRKETDTHDLFFLTFVGEFVEIVGSTLSGDGTAIVPLVVTGFLLDLDDKFYYLSDDGMSVKRAIKITDLKAIEIVETKTHFDQMLDNVLIPDKKEQSN